MSPRPGSSAGLPVLLAFAGVVVLGGANAIAVKETVAELSPLWSCALLLAEPISPVFVIGGTIVLLGVYLGVFAPDVRHTFGRAPAPPEAEAEW